MNVRKLIEYLETLPEDTKAQVVQAHDAGYQGIWNSFESVDPEYNTYFCELSDGTKFLELGEAQA